MTPNFFTLTKCFGLETTYTIFFSRIIHYCIIFHYCIIYSAPQKRSHPSFFAQSPAPPNNLCFSINPLTSLLNFFSSGGVTVIITNVGRTLVWSSAGQQGGVPDCAVRAPLGSLCDRQGCSPADHKQPLIMRNTHAIALYWTLPPSAEPDTTQCIGYCT